MKKSIFAIVCCIAAISCTTEPTGPQVVAHRGHWDAEGSAQNSLEALRLAGELGVYGSEFDVNMTSDGVLVINHDFTFHGIMIDENPYDAIKDSTLANGEVIPTLEQYLELGVKYPELHMVLELKSKGDAGYEDRATTQIVALLKKYDLVERTDIISFSLTACRKFAEQLPGTMVEYLTGDVAPAELKEMGIMGIDYHFSVFEAHPEWVEEAHSLGMICNAWTVSKEENINAMLDLGVDFVTTNAPVLATELIAERKQAR